MRFEIIILIITGLIIANIHSDGKYLKMALGWQKYYKMVGVGFIGIAVCWLMRKNPLQAQELLTTTNDYIKYLPIDKNVKNAIFNFKSVPQYMNGGKTIIPGNPENTKYKNRLFESGKATTKRSVSETKKKFVAAKQNWMCGDCKNQLSAWFEVDHTIRLDKGGTNHIDNLVALCRECHGKKTAMENL